MGRDQASKGRFHKVAGIKKGRQVLLCYKCETRRPFYHRKVFLSCSQNIRPGILSAIRLTGTLHVLFV